VAPLQRYRLLVRLLAPVLVPYTAWLGLRHGDARYLMQRLGFGRVPVAPGAIWVHAVSVGEVNAVAALARRLAERYRPRPLVVSTGTPTGGAAARRRLGDVARQVYLPLDWRWSVRRWLRRLRPRCLLVMETELWPNLYRECARAGVPIVLVNGRLSLRSLRTESWWRRLQHETLAHVRGVLARSQTDAETFMGLGMEPARVRTLGNLKFAMPGARAAPIELGRRYVLAASTRPGEERPIVEQWCRAPRAGRLLVLAPRHPDRLREILRGLAPLGLRVAVRSRREPVTAETDIYLADTLGELPGFMAGAELVIMGGAFASFGGHNVLEPAQLGRAVIFGPHMDNFAHEAELLCAHEAALQLGSVEELGDCLAGLFAHPERIAALGENGARLVASRARVLEDYLAALEELLPELSSAS
jgi:3-deoxy-D-manno-octulosonic-acid transferase